MSRLIDAEYLLDLIKDINDGERFGYIDAEDINNAPTVDAVPVVRCIECKYASFSFHQGELYISCENNNGLFRDVPEDGYCYCGEKVTE